MNQHEESQNKQKIPSQAKQDVRAYFGLMEAADEVGKTPDGHVEDSEFLDKMSKYIGLLDGFFWVT